MKILYKDLKKKRIKLKIETLDDLWHLSNIVEPGDLVYAKTLRRETQRLNAIRSERTEKKPVFLGVKVEKTEFHKYSNWFRVHGVIFEGEDLGEYHTINLEVGSVFLIEKDWKKHHLERLEEALQSSKIPKILIVVMDEGEADFGVLREYGVDFVLSISKNISGKRNFENRKAEREEFFSEVAKKILEYGVTTIVAGPGFVKEDFAKFAKEKYGLEFFLENCSTTGKTGIYEVLKRGTVEKIYKESRTSKEIMALEDLFLKILKDKAVYGVKEVERVLKMGNAEKILVVDKLLREEKKIEEMLEKARKIGSDILVISSEHEGGERLISLGGIAAILRWREKL